MQRRVNQNSEVVLRDVAIIELDPFFLVFPLLSLMDLRNMSFEISLGREKTTTDLANNVDLQMNFVFMLL